MWNKLKEQFNLLKLEKKKLCLITNSDQFDTKDDFLNAIASALQGGVDILQLNEKNIPDNVLVDIGNKIRILCDEFGTTFIVNGRADIAKIVEADGIHLEHGGLAMEDARMILGENIIIGKSVNSKDEIIDAENEGADYLLFETDIFANLNPDIADNELDCIINKFQIPIFFNVENEIENFIELKNMGVRKIALRDSLMYSTIPEQMARNILYTL